MVYGVVLAGGYSSRAGCNKMLLQFDGDSLINHTIKQMMHAVDKIVVVTGHYHADIVSAVSNLKDVIVVQNTDYDKGMFSSVKTGLKYVQGDAFIVPGDCPMICRSVYTLLLNKKGDIRVPTYQGRKGHPLYLKETLIHDLLAYDDTSNLKAFRNTQNVRYYETNCQGILKDIDTMQAYKSEVERIETNENQ